MGLFNWQGEFYLIKDINFAYTRRWVSKYHRRMFTTWEYEAGKLSINIPCIGFEAFPEYGYSLAVI